MKRLNRCATCFNCIIRYKVNKNATIKKKLKIKVNPNASESRKFIKFIYCRENIWTKKYKTLDMVKYGKGVKSYGWCKYYKGE
jgi:hypothetical protein